MALLDFLKRKKEVEKAKPVEKNTEKALADKKEEKPEKSQGHIVREPHISEKATTLAEKNQYTFKIHKNTNKPEIKKMVEKTYKVNVLSVNVIKIPKKKRRLGRTEGWKKGYHKAVVKIQDGQKIEVI